MKPTLEPLKIFVYEFSSLYVRPFFFPKRLVGIASKQSPLKLVEPGVPDKSYMYLKLVGRHESVGGSGLQMPPAKRLDEAGREAIRQWIEQGAKRN